jgi:hypothetical protein
MEAARTGLTSKSRWFLLRIDGIQSSMESARKYLEAHPDLAEELILD